MYNCAIALPISQHFNTVFPELANIIGILSVHDLKQLSASLQRSPYRKVYHTDGFINIQFQEQMTDKFISLLNSYGISHMSFDCGPSCIDVSFSPEKNNCYKPNNSARTLKPGEIVKAAKNRIDFIKGFFNGTIGLENLDYHRGGAYEYICEPEFITEVLKRLDVYLTIDIAHVLVTSFNLGLEPIEYIKKLPLALVREVHLSHPEAGDDVHDCPTSYEYELLRYILANSSPEFIMIEYYQDPGKIIKENTKLYRFLKEREMS